MTRFGIILMLLLGVVACSSAPGPTGIVSGRLVAGPVCPVETDPPDPACQPVPVSGARVEVVSSGGVIVDTTSGDDGLFRLEVPVGVVQLRFGDVPGLMGTPAEVSIQVVEKQTLDLGDISYDTGIR